jgi:hypothetical protein
MRYLQSIAMLALIVLLCAVTTLIVHVDRIVLHSSVTLNTTVQHTNNMIDDLDRSVKLLPKVINDTRLTLDNVNKGAIDERMYLEHELPLAMGNVERILVTANELLLSADTTVRSVGASVGALQTQANATLGAAQSAISATQPLLAAGTATVRDVDKFITAPPLEQTVANAAAITHNVDAITADAAFEANKFAHPPHQPWYKRIVPYTLDAGKLLYDFVR